MVAVPADAYRPFRGVSETAPASRPAWPPRPPGGRRRRSTRDTRAASCPATSSISVAIDLPRPQHHPAAGPSQRQAQLERHRRRCQRPRQHQVEAITAGRSRVMLRAFGDHRRLDPQLRHQPPQEGGLARCRFKQRHRPAVVDRQRDAGRAVAAAHVHDQLRQRLPDQRSRPQGILHQLPPDRGLIRQRRHRERRVRHQPAVVLERRRRVFHVLHRVLFGPHDHVPIRLDALAGGGEPAH